MLKINWRIFWSRILIQGNLIPPFPTKKLTELIKYMKILGGSIKRRMSLMLLLHVLTNLVLATEDLFFKIQKKANHPMAKQIILRLYLELLNKLKNRSYKIVLAPHLNKKIVKQSQHIFRNISICFRKMRNRWKKMK